MPGLPHSATFIAVLWRTTLAQAPVVILWLIWSHADDTSMSVFSFHPMIKLLQDTHAFTMCSVSFSRRYTSVTQRPALKAGETEREAPVESFYYGAQEVWLPTDCGGAFFATAVRGNDN